MAAIGKLQRTADKAQVVDSLMAPRRIGFGSRLQTAETRRVADLPRHASIESSIDQSAPHLGPEPGPRVSFVDVAGQSLEEPMPEPALAAFGIGRHLLVRAGHPIAAMRARYEMRGAFLLHEVGERPEGPHVHRGMGSRRGIDAVVGVEDPTRPAGPDVQGDGDREEGIGAPHLLDPPEYRGVQNQVAEESRAPHQVVDAMR
jgi:hypothetical protein